MACVPKLRFKGFEDEWDNATLGDLGTVLMCRRIFEHQTSSTGEVPFYKIGTFGRTPDAFISRKLFSEYKEKYPYPKKGDILISAAGTIGRIVEYKGEDAYYQDSNIVWLNVTSDRLLNKYLYYYYQTIVWSKLEGGTVKRLYNKDLLDTKIHLPSIEEQQKIASFFSLLDQKIEKQQEKIEQLELFKKGMLQKIFSQEIRFKDENGQDFPEWDSELFEQVATNNSNKIIPQSKTNAPCIELENIVGNRGRINGFYLSQEQQSTKNEFAKGSVLFGKLRPYLKKYWYATFDGICSSEIWVLTSKSPRITNEFLYFIIQSDTFQQAANISSGSKMPRTEWDSIRSLEIPLPSIEEQKKIASFLFTLEEKISKEESKFESLIQLKNGLLQQMFV
ncbi:restriction endonuclease subunit S [Thermicanus aegyptius]|uniref:restriction endonuclease subunit S n=1 Tax=Thermicanus aegyptius TaxID=94009 RepID=UPI00040D5D9E|nr:restriction endonuclease subunit S [Thermicanus aegyptius]